MNELRRQAEKLPPEQQAIRDRCFHPSGTFVEFPKEEIEQSISERFEKIVRENPDRIAVKVRDQFLTYDQLNAAANRVARAILARPGTVEEPIALLFEHDLSMMIAILGVLKAGRVYLPIDLSFPKERVAYMIEDSQTGLLVTDTRNHSFAREFANERIRLLNVDALDSNCSSENLCLPLAPQALAYLVYTSGSSGQPKGVIHSHQNVLYSVFVETNSYHISCEDRLGLTHTFSSSASVKYLFGALLNGASLFLFDAKKQPLAQLAIWLLQERITICDFVTALFRTFTQSLSGNEIFSSLRLISLGSETVTQQEIELFKKHFHADTELAILLATSETATIRRYFVDKERDFHGVNVPAGYQVEGKKIVLLDEEGNELGSDVVGEIAVKSRFLSLGYWRNPDLTKTKFLPDPNGGDERIYLTGDLGLVQSDGCLLHLGRKDLRVKIRGYTVEAGEVERVLRENPCIKDVVVTGSESKSGGFRLVAYYVPAVQPAPTSMQLVKFTKGRLPSYMVPSTFLALDVLPLTPSGKIDRRALPEPSTSRPDLDIPYLGPLSPTQEELGKIWAEVIGIDRVGIHDNFFDLGGHSLAASQVISRVIETFRLALPLEALFDAPTVAEMAEIIVQNQARKVADEDLARLLSEVEAMSEGETQRVLAEESARRGDRD